MSLSAAPTSIEATRSNSPATTPAAELLSSRRCYEVFRTRQEIDERNANALKAPSFELGAEAQNTGTVCFIEENRASELVERYFAALCAGLRARLGIRVEAGSSEGELRHLLADD